MNSPDSRKSRKSKSKSSEKQAQRGALPREPEPSPLLPSGHHETAACADTQESAESWLFLALDLAEQKDHLYFMMDAQMNLACVAMMKGNGDKAVELLSQHLQDWIENCGPQVCKCCHPLPSGSPAVGWLTEERGCMMQVLQRGAPEVGV